MSLFSSIQLAGNALQATQIGLQVVGQNIANANTPGYIREEAELTPGPPQRVGGVVLGLGVRVDGVIQKIDRLLNDRLRSASGDRASSEAQEQAYHELEGVINELSNADLSTSLDKFVSSIHDILNQPESAAVRNLAVLQGQNLANDIQRLGRRVDNLRTDRNREIVNTASDINRLVEEIRDLNLKITATEAGELSKSDAVGLRDQRYKALSELGELIDIRVEEQPDGATNVFLGADYLVFEGLSRQVETKQSVDRGLTIDTIQLAESNSPLQVSSGRVAGLTAGRDEILGGFLDKLDGFARTLAFEFNKLFSSAQGLRGYRQMSSQVAVADGSAALDAAGLPFTPVNGSFQVQVFDRRTGLTKTTEIPLALTGLDGDTTLMGLAQALDAVDGIGAAVDGNGRLQLRSDSPDLEFAFANDNSGVLAALGLATFFTGDSARTLSVNEAVRDDPAKFAASRGGIGADTDAAVDMAGFLDLPLESAGGANLAEIYDRLAGDTTQAAATATAVADGLRVFEQSLESQHAAISGVSLDEEAVRLITFQRAFQASAKYIATLNDLLQLLVSL